MTRDRWWQQRSLRTFNSEAAKEGGHRRCPICKGSGDVCVFAGSRIDPPDYDSCDACGGWGRVDQDGWDEAQHLIAQQEAAEEAMAEHFWNERGFDR